MAGPLDKVKVVDLTTVVMGPYATRVLGDMGAEVIKVESFVGDSVRRLGLTRNPNMSSYFLNLNRNKRSIVLDLKHPKGLEAVRRLIAKADVLISNVRPRAMERLGLSYGQSRQDNPGLIYVSLVGYGQDGPYAARPAYDDLMQGATGLAALSGQHGGDDKPRYAPFNMSDRVVALFAVNAVVGALYAREKTGRGQAVEVPMFESMTDFVLVEHLGGLGFEPPVGAHGFPRTLNPLRAPYKTKDGYIATQIHHDQHWKKFFAICGLTEKYADDPRFKNLATRTAHLREVYTVMGDILATRSTAEWLELLNGADIPAEHVHTVSSLLEDPHHVATGFFRETDHPSEGRIRGMRIPGKWSETQPEMHLEAPLLGEHSAQILAELGYGQSEIEQMLTDKVTLVTPGPRQHGPGGLT